MVPARFFRSFRATPRCLQVPRVPRRSTLGETPVSRYSAFPPICFPVLFPLTIAMNRHPVWKLFFIWTVVLSAPSCTTVHTQFHGDVTGGYQHDTAKRQEPVSQR